MSRRLVLVIAALGLALALLAGLALKSGLGGAGADAPAVGGPFQLVASDGRAVDQKVLDGRWSVVFFGYTHCPDICPTTLFEMAIVERDLGPAADKLQTVFITVDPERDTPAQMRAYAANPAFPKRLVALTGSTAQTDAAASTFRVFHQKGEGADYAVNHSSYAFLMNPRGKLACVLPYELTPEQTAQRIRAAMARGAGAEAC